MSRRRLSIGAWGTVAALTAAALGLGWHEANRPENPTGATIVTGGVGQEVVAAGVRLRVDEVRSAPEILVPDDDYDDDYDDDDGAAPPAPLTTPGRWLVARVAFTGEASSGDVDYYYWRSADGVEYRLSERVDRDRGTAQPGEWWHEDLVFEVPPEAATRGTLLVEVEGVRWEVPLQLAEIRIDDVDQTDRIEPVALTPGSS